jgi:Zinc finger C-x8-C-x5-C-x3-H type (and similar)
MSFSSASTAPTSPTNSDQATRHRLYRTRQCKHYLKGFCLLGGQCGFAHGEEDMLPHPNVNSPRMTSMTSPRSDKLSSNNDDRRRSIHDEAKDYDQCHISTDGIRKSLVDELINTPTCRPRSLSQSELNTLFKGW